MDNTSLKKVFIFSELNDDDIELIKNFSRSKTYNKGDIIFFDTEPYAGFYVVINGLVKIYKISKDGREHILHIVDRFNTFAEVPLFENLGQIFLDEFRYPANAMALIDGTEVLLIRARAFLELLEQNSSMCIKMISGFAKRLRHLNNHIENITLKDVSKRVAGFILSEYSSHNKKISEPAKNDRNIIMLKISKNDLASYLGTIPETLSRTFKKLEDDDVIDVNGKTIIIKDIVKLKELSI